MSLNTSPRRSLSSPLPPRAQRVAGRGRGWGATALQPSMYTRLSKAPPTPPAFAIALAGDPPRRFAGGGLEAPRPGHEAAP